MSVAANVISAVVKSVVGDKVGDGLAKELADISIDGISENGIDKINDFISGKKAKMEHILSKREYEINEYSRKYYRTCSRRNKRFI